MSDLGSLTPEEIARLKSLLELSPEQLANFRSVAEHGELLVDAAQRGYQRRLHHGKASGDVRKNPWTAAQARLNGLMNSLRSAMRAHDRSLSKLAPAQAEADRTAADVKMVRDALDAFQAEMAALGRDVTLLKDSDAPEVAD